MTDPNRPDFDQALDIFARMFRLTPLDSEAKFGYFKALKHHRIEGFTEGMNTLSQTYEPRRKDDFPTPAAITKAITGVAEAGAPREELVSRTYAEIKASYKRRGILIGEEAREQLEAEWASRRQAADEDVNANP